MNEFQLNTAMINGCVVDGKGGRLLECNRRATHLRLTVLPCGTRRTKYGIFAASAAEIDRRPPTRISCRNHVRLSYPNNIETLDCRPILRSGCFPVRKRRPNRLLQRAQSLHRLSLACPAARESPGENASKNRSRKSTSSTPSGPIDTSIEFSHEVSACIRSLRNGASFFIQNFLRYSTRSTTSPNGCLGGRASANSKYWLVASWLRKSIKSV